MILQTKINFLSNVRIHEKPQLYRIYRKLEDGEEQILSEFGFRSTVSCYKEYVQISLFSEYEAKLEAERLQRLEDEHKTGFLIEVRKC